MSDNNNNEDKLELDLSNNSEETLQIDFDDLNTDVELSFDDLQDSIDITPVDENQPIENIELMSEHAPHKENEPTLKDVQPVKEETPELTLEDVQPDKKEESVELTLEDVQPDKKEEPAELTLEDVQPDKKEESVELTLEDVQPDKKEEPVTLSLEDVQPNKKEEPASLSLSNDSKEDTTPVASTDPNSDPLGMDWQEPFDNAPKTDKTTGTTPESDKDISVNISDNPKKKSKSKVPVIIGTIVAVLALLAGIGYYFAMINPVTSNSIMATVLKPNKYYQMIEGKNINAMMKKSSKNMETTLSLINEQTNAAVATNSTITLSEGLTSLGSSLGEYGSILQSIKTVNIKTDSLSQDNTGSYILELGLNDNTLISINIVMDTKNNAIYVQCPTILKRWIKIPINTAGKNIDFSKGKKLNSKDVQTLMQRYIPIFISNFDNVSLNKDKNIKIAKSKVDVSEIEIKMSEENLDKIGKLFLTELKKDDLIYSYLKSYGFVSSKKEYTKAVDSLDKDLANDKSSDDKKKEETKKVEFPIIMTVYVDKSGTIVGRDIKQDKDLLNYRYYDSGKVTKLAAEYKSGDVTIKASGNIKDNNKTYSGSTVITYTQELDTSSIETASEDTSIETNSEDALTQGKSYQVTLDYNDVKVINEKKGLFKGKFTITPSDIKNMKGVSLNLNYSVQNNKQASEVILNAMNQPMISIATTQDTSQQSNVTIPSKFIDQTALTKDYLTQYNVLLEVDTYTPVATFMKTMNNPMINQLISAFYVSPGYNKLNGKQTAKDLIYIAKLNKNTSLYKLAMYGYKMTVAGKNPGLDAQ